MMLHSQQRARNRVARAGERRDAHLWVLIIHPDGLEPISPVDESQFSGCFPPLVAMMKATDSRQSNDLGLRRRSMRRGPAWRGILQLGVDSVRVVVVDMLAEKASKGVLVRDDHVIESFSARTPDASLDDPILPRASTSLANRAGIPCGASGPRFPAER